MGHLLELENFCFYSLSTFVNYLGVGLRTLFPSMLENIISSFTAALVNLMSSVQLILHTVLIREERVSCLTSHLTFHPSRSPILLPPTLVPMNCLILRLSTVSLGRCKKMLRPLLMSQLLRWLSQPLEVEGVARCLTPLPNLKVSMWVLPHQVSHPPSQTQGVNVGASTSSVSPPSQTQGVNVASKDSSYLPS